MSQRILVADDELFMVRLIQHTLEKAGYELIPARNSQEARAALKEEKPDLIVGNANVVNDGLQKTLKEMQQQDQCGPIPMICVSDAPSTGALGLNENPDRVVFTKPFSPTKLLAEVRRMIPKPAEGGAAS